MAEMVVEVLAEIGDLFLHLWIDKAIEKRSAKFYKVCTERRKR